MRYVPVMLSLCLGCIEEAPSQTASKPRRPVALALAKDGDWLYVANRRTGTISIIAAKQMRLTAEHKIGVSLSDCALTADNKLLVTDEGGKKLVVLEAAGGKIVETERRPLRAPPVSVRTSADGRTWFVVSMWPRQITLLRGSTESVVHLSFAPRRVLPTLDGRWLLVADAFGGNLAVIDLTEQKVVATHVLEGHNIRGLAISNGKVLLAEQILQPRTPTLAEEIHWGNVVRQVIRSLPLDNVITAGKDPLEGSELRPLGEPGRGSADPEDLQIGPDGTVVVSCGGVGEIQMGQDKDPKWKRLSVGKRPTALTISPDGQRAYVADSFEDKIVCIGLRERKVIGDIALSNERTNSVLDRGEIAFYDGRLSHEGWMSCHSCHTDGHSNGKLSDTQSDGGFGAPKRVPTLLGVGDTGPWSWRGLAPRLEDQVRKSILTTQHNLTASEDTVRALTEYLQSLQAHPATSLQEGETKRGQAIFARLDCSRCHVPPNYTSARTYDVGLADESGNREFNPPSLRGVGRGGPYFHDGRAATLEEVFSQVGHPGKALLSAEETGDLVRYLRAL